MSYSIAAGLGTDASYAAIPAAGKIVTKDGWEYQITPDDVLWLARSVQHEAGNYAATAWTYAQRAAAFRRWRTLTDLLRAHSQPINPIWMRDGEMCRPGGRFHGRDECAERRLAARDRATTTPWSQIRPEVREIVSKFVTARLENPVPKAANFANATVTTSYLLRNPSSAVVLREGNWYITEARTNDWPDDFVTIRHAGRIAGPSLAGRARSATSVRFGVAAMGFAAAATFAGWSAWRYSKLSARSRAPRSR